MEVLFRFGAHPDKAGADHFFDKAGQRCLMLRGDLDDSPADMQVMAYVTSSAQ